MDNTRKDFIENIVRLNNQNRKVIQDNSESIFIIISVSNDSTAEPTITFTSIAKTTVYTKVFTYNSFSECKSAMGFDGSWKAFIDTVFNAINHKEGGEIKMEIKKKKLTMTMIHPLANDLKVSSHIAFDNSYTKDNSEYNILVFDSLTNLYNNKLEIIKANDELAAQLKDSEHKSLITNSSNFNSGVSQKDVSRGVLEIKKNIKRKYQSNLINPNIKKRKKKGVEFIQDEEENGKSDNE